MAKKPSNASENDVHRMPWEERGSETEDSAATKLEGILGSHPEFADDEATDDPVEPESGDEPDEPIEEDEFEEDESDEVEESEEVEDPDDELEEEPDESDDDEETYTVRVDGEEIEVTFDELISGYSRTADYTRKTQALAEERKAFQEEAQSTRAAREQYLQQVAALEGFLQAQMPEEPDWDKLERENPAEFTRQWAAHQRRQRELAQVQEERQRVQTEHYQDVVQAENERLVEAIPEWQDEETAKAEKRALAEYATSTYGFTKQDLESVVDHRIMLILRKAQKYDELTSEGQKNLEGKRKKGSRKKTLKPGGKSSSRRRPKRSKRSRDRQRKARESLAQTGRTDHAAAAIEEMLGEDF